MRASKVGTRRPSVALAKGHPNPAATCTTARCQTRLRKHTVPSAPLSTCPSGARLFKTSYVYESACRTTSRLLSIAYSTATIQYTASLSDFYHVNGILAVLSFKLPPHPMPSRLDFPMHLFFRHTKAPLVRLNSPSGIPAKMFMGSV